MPGLKRLASSSHEEVYRFVRHKRIHAADELFRVAKERSAKDSGALLVFCCGCDDISMKRNLQQEIDAMWMPDTGLQSIDPSGESQVVRAHLKPLSETRLRALKTQARAPAKRPRSGIPAQHVQIATPPSKNACFLQASEQLRCSRKRDLTLLDSLACRGEAVFRPFGGVWRLRDFYEVLVAVREDPTLAGVAPISTAEGGFRIPRSEDGWRALLRAAVATPRIPFDELTVSQRLAASAEVRFGIGCGALPWQPPSEQEQDPQHAWIDAMPEDPLFEVDVLRGLPLEERLVRLWSHRHVEDSHLFAIVRAFEACEHLLQETVGFKLKDGAFKITGRRLLAPRHKSDARKGTFGAICAQAAVAEASTPSPILAILGSNRVSKLRTKNWSPEKLHAITDGTSSEAGGQGNSSSGRLKPIADGDASHQ